MLTKKQEKTLKEYERLTPRENLAYGSLTSSNPKPGTYRFMPLLGHISVYSGQTYLIIQGILLLTYQDKHAGTISWTIPLNKGTKEEGLALLAALGWDGRVWPDDAGWPDGDQHEATGLERLLYESYIDASLVFPPHPERGSRVIRVLVSKSNGRFPMPIQLEEEDLVAVTPELRSRFDVLVADPSIFKEKGGGATLPTPRFRFLGT